MEIFKDLERMSKMKAFSKEGLSKRAKMKKKKKEEVQDTPEKAECKEWIEGCIETLSDELGTVAVFAFSLLLLLLLPQLHFCS